MIESESGYKEEFVDKELKSNELANGDLNAKEIESIDIEAEKFNGREVKAGVVAVTTNDVEDTVGIEAEGTTEISFEAEADEPTKIKAEGIKYKAFQAAEIEFDDIEEHKIEVFAEKDIVTGEINTWENKTEDIEYKELKVVELEVDNIEENKVKVSADKEIVIGEIKTKEIETEDIEYTSLEAVEIEVDDIEVHKIKAFADKEIVIEEIKTRDIEIELSLEDAIQYVNDVKVDSSELLDCKCPVTFAGIDVLGNDVDTNNIDIEILPVHGIPMVFNTMIAEAESCDINKTHLEVYGDDEIRQTLLPTNIGGHSLMGREKNQIKN